MPNPIKPLFIDLLKPFEIQAASKSLTLEVRELTEIPDDMFTDWKIYEEILFHLVQNSIKFNKYSGNITFDLCYSEMAFPQDPEFIKVF